MIVNEITEMVENEEKTVGICFNAENDDEKMAFRTWYGYKHIGTIGSDDKVINILFTDIDEYLNGDGGVLDASDST